MKNFKLFFESHYRYSTKKTIDNLLELRKITSQSPFNFEWYFTDEDIQQQFFWKTNNNVILLAKKVVPCIEDKLNGIILNIRITERNNDGTQIIIFEYITPTIFKWINPQYHKDYNDIIRAINQFENKNEGFRLLTQTMNISQEVIYIEDLDILGLNEIINLFKYKFQELLKLYKWPGDLNNPEEAIKFLGQYGLPKSIQTELKLILQLPVDPKEINNNLMYKYM